MAELVDPYDGFPDRDQFDDYREYHEAERAVFEELMDDHPDSPDDGLEGAMLRWPRADGYAHYRVVGTNPLQIQHVPYGDGWQVEAALIRGLREQDVIDQIERRNRLQELTSNS